MCDAVNLRHAADCVGVLHFVAEPMGDRDFRGITIAKIIIASMIVCEFNYISIIAIYGSKIVITFLLLHIFDTWLLHLYRLKNKSKVVQLYFSP